MQQQGNGGLSLACREPDHSANDPLRCVMLNQGLVMLITIARLLEVDFRIGGARKTATGEDLPASSLQSNLPKSIDQSCYTTSLPYSGPTAP